MTKAHLASCPDDLFAEDEQGETPFQAKDAGAFRTIGEAAAELGLKTHVLRFWETKFDALKPLKRPDGRRYYRAEDMEVLKTLQNLLHVQGMTIRGAIRTLSGVDADPGADFEDEADIAAPGASVRELQDAVQAAVARGEFRGDAIVANIEARQRLESLLADLTRLKSRLDEVRTAA
jgi:DNA-binding transcriptional MerR regulator